MMEESRPVRLPAEPGTAMCGLACARGLRRWTAKGKVIVSNTDLINVSETAGEAFGSFDWNEHDGKGVRLFVQGFG